MSKNSINIENIDDFNPWHKNDNFTFTKEKALRKRDQFYLVQDYLKSDLMVSIVGLRRTGKSTIIKQLINSLFEQKIKPSRIFFYEFEDERVNLDKTLKFYFKNILREDLYETECYIFLDELQMIEGWQNVVKKYYDINSQIKFIVSGSTHLYLHKNTKESLAGRIVDVKLLPFSWLEFLNFKYKKRYSTIEHIFENNFLDKLQNQADILLYKSDFLTFISWGEFPQFFKEEKLDNLNQYYKNSILEKIFLKDIQFFDINNRMDFENFFKTLNQNTTQEINISNLSRELEMSRSEIKKYFNILKKMFLYSLVYKYEKTFRKQIRSFKKGYVTSLNLLNAISDTNFWNIDNDKFGHIIETFVFNELQKCGLENVTFYHDTKKKKEVDFILKKGGHLLPVEVKTVEEVRLKHLKNLIFFAKKNNEQRSIVIYGGDEIKYETIQGIRIEFLPYWVV